MEKYVGNGHINAQYSVANYYEHGFGIGVDMNQAIYWYKKAAHNGARRAKDALTRLH